MSDRPCNDYDKAFIAVLVDKVVDLLLYIDHIKENGNEDPIFITRQMEAVVERNSDKKRACIEEIYSLMKTATEPAKNVGLR